MASCKAAFPTEVKLECILAFIQEVRGGQTSLPQIAVDGMWLAGSGLTVVGKLSTELPEVKLMSLEEGLSMIESKIQSYQAELAATTPADGTDVSILASGVVAPKGVWDVILPILLELLKNWLGGQNAAS